MHFHRALIGLTLLGCSSTTIAIDEMASCETEAGVYTKVFEAGGCADGVCHDADAPKANLDLQSVGLVDRLVEQESIHDACKDQVLVRAGKPAESFMMRKLLALQGDCGDPMPAELETLSPEQRQCVAAWIVAIEP